MSVVSRMAMPLRSPSPRRLVRRRRHVLWAVPFAAAASWGAWRLASDPAATAAPPLAAPTSTLVAFASPRGERTTAPKCWMVAIDESASMRTADVLGTRADAVRAAGEFLAVHGLDDDTIGVTWFAERVSAQAPREPAAADNAPRAPLNLGSGTDIAAGVSGAMSTMDASCTTAEHVLVLVSDGDATSPLAFAAAADELRGAPDGTTVHLVAMNGSGAFEPSRSFWQDPALGLASVRTVDSFAEDEVAAAVAAILTIETGQQVTPR